MRVMLISHRFPPDDLGGVERYTQSLASELARRGDTVSIVARRPGREPTRARMLRERLTDGALLYRLLAGNDKPLPWRFGEDQRQVEQLLTMALLESQPELVHINHLIGFSPRAIQLAHRLGAAVVLSLHDFHFACPRVHLQTPAGGLCKGPAFGRECAAVCFANGGAGDRVYWGLRAIYFQRALEMAEHVIAYSQYVASYFTAMRARAPIHVIENGIPPAPISAGGAPDSDTAPGRDLTLAYCGTVAPHKGPHIILEALETARLERVCLRVIGQTPDRAYGARLREKAARIPGLKLQMYGKYSRGELPFLLRAVDCVIVPSVVPEAGPIVPREALGLGVPVLVSKLGALPEVIRDGENGFVFDPSHPAELAALLRRLANDPDLLPRLRAGARGTPLITSAAHAERVRAVYEAAIEDFQRRAADRPGPSEFDFLHEALAEQERGFAQAPGLKPARTATIGR